MYQDYYYSANKQTHIWVGSVISTTGSANRFYYTFNIPSSARYLWMMAIGPGGAGGGGGASAAGVAGGGGGGGASGGSAQVLISTMYLPKTLYISPGQSKVGLTGQVQGGGTSTSISGASSFITIRNGSTTAGNLIIAGNPGNNGASAAGSSGTSSATVAAAATTTRLQGFGLFKNYAGGTSGGAGNGASAGSNITPFSGQSLNTGGGGGGGVNAGTTTSNGGSILTSTFYPQVDGGLAGGFSGIDGYDFTVQLGDMDLPLISSGGSGGGGNTLVNVGGKGGNGGIGSGGGGGGGTNGIASVGGAGGDGGPGAIIIVCI